jgi:hypothetical protein
MRSSLTVDEEASLIGREKMEVDIRAPPRGDECEAGFTLEAEEGEDDIRAPSRGDECEASCDAGGMVDEHQAKCNRKTCRFACVEKFQAK